MVEPVPTLCLDQIPPSFVSFVAGHNDMFDVHARVLDRELFLDLPDTTGDDGDRSETLFEGGSVAPVPEVPMSHVDGNVLHINQRCIYMDEIHPAITYWRDGLIRLEIKGGSQV